jgi:hypothetical protein
VGYGSYNSWNVQGAYGGPLTDRWSARVSAIYQRRDDWVDNTRVGAPNSGFEGYDEAAGRVQFLYEGDDFEALFNLHKRKLNGTARLFRANIIQKGGNSLVENFDRDKVANDGVNFSDLEPGRQRACSGTSARSRCTRSPATRPPNRSTAVTSTVATVQRSSAPALRPRPDSVLVGVGRRPAAPPPVDAGSPHRVQRVGPLRLAGRRLLLR